MRLVLIGPPHLQRSWQRVFDGTEVAVMRGDLVRSAVGAAWVSPANSFGWMDAGLDWLIRRAYERSGYDITAAVQAAIMSECGGELPVGQALVVPTPGTPYTHLIVAPTMRTPRPAFWSLNAYLAFRAVLLTTQRWNAAHPDESVDTLYCPGLATGVGKMPHGRCARQMREAWDQVMRPSPAMIPPLGVATIREQILRFR